MSFVPAFQQVLGAGLENYHKPKYWEICGIKVQFKPVPNGVGQGTWKRTLEEWLPKYEEVGWLECWNDSEKVSLPNFENHNGETAKKRALKNKRQTEWRRNSGNNVDSDASTGASTREEKRREENPPPKSPKGRSKSGPPEYTDDFLEFWERYPKKVGKGDAFKAWRKVNPGSELKAKILWAVDQQSRSEQWQRDGGQYVPNPATWLNQARWDDELEKPESAQKQVPKKFPGVN